MHRQPQSISEHKLARYFAWAWLWLLTYALHLAQDGAKPRRRLQRMARNVACLIVLRAARMAPLHPERRLARRVPSARPGFTRRAPTNPTRVLRAGIGSRLRRRLRGASNGARLSALFNALRDGDALARHLARRMTRMLTRLRPIVIARPPVCAVVSLACRAPCAANTS